LTPQAQGPAPAAAPTATGGFLHQLEVGLVQNFCTLIGDRQTGACVVCDPAFEVDRIRAAVAAHGLQVTAVVLTHSHLDHIEGVPELCRRVGPLPVYIGAGEQDPVRELCAAAGVRPELVPLAGGEELRCGSLQLSVLATPGHTRAGRSYYVPALAAVLTGDTLFVGSCGRPRDPAGAAQLFASLQLLGELPEETRLYPGHDYGPRPTSTISWEQEFNPFLRCRDAAAFAALCRRRG
jgi:glyoxylase-like metal-dependent hydrolase (beta-lactamase superfamily II)